MKRYVPEKGLDPAAECTIFHMMKASNFYFCFLTINTLQCLQSPGLSQVVLLLVLLTFHLFNYTYKRSSVVYKYY